MTIKMNSEISTVVIHKNAERCEDENDIQKLLHDYDEYYLNWQKYINYQIEQNGMSYYGLALQSGISKNTIKKWCRQGGAPRSRNTYIKLGFGFGMNSKMVNYMLTRYGGYHRLHVKNLFDAVCVWLLDKGGFTYKDAEYLYNIYCGDKWSIRYDKIETQVLHNKISAINTEQLFLEFVKSNLKLFTPTYSKLNEYLRGFIVANKSYEGAVSVHSICIEKGIPARFEKVISEIGSGKPPRREKLIALGLHLDMMTDEINLLLELAGMESLCARNRIECVLIYALQKVSLLHPEIPLSNAMQLLSVLKDDSFIIEHCKQIVEEYMLNNYSCSENEIVSIRDYIRNILLELDLEEAAELLEMI